MKEHVLRNKHIYLFVLIAYGISWGSYYLFGDAEYSIPWFLTKWGFTLAGLFVIFLTKDKSAKNQLVLYARQKPTIPHILIGLSPLLAYAVSMVILVPLAQLNVVQDSTLWEWIYVFLFAPASGILFYFLFRGGMGEELGLRGYVLPQLAKQNGLLKASMILATFWAIWHYPAWINNGLFNLIAGTITVYAWSAIFTWVFVKTRSLFTVILLHATGNASDDILEWIFPNLNTFDWEVIYILSIVVVGVVAIVLLSKHKQWTLSQIEEDKQ